MLISVSGSQHESSRLQNLIDLNGQSGKMYVRRTIHGIRVRANYTSLLKTDHVFGRDVDTIEW